MREEFRTGGAADALDLAHDLRLPHAGAGELHGRLHALPRDGPRPFHALDLVLRLDRAFLLEKARSHLDVRIRLFDEAGVEGRAHGVLAHHADSGLWQAEFAEVGVQRLDVVSGVLDVVDPGGEAREVTRGVDFEQGGRARAARQKQHRIAEVRLVAGYVHDVSALSKAQRAGRRVDQQEVEISGVHLGTDGFQSSIEFTGWGS